MRLVVLAEYIVMMLIGVIREFHVAASGSASIQRVSGLEDLSWGYVLEFAGRLAATSALGCRLLCLGVPSRL